MIATTSPMDPTLPVSVLRNVGKATLADFHCLGISTLGDLATRDADTLYFDLCKLTQHRHDPCVHDVFSATIHQAKTGEALDWWAFTSVRKARLASGDFLGLIAPGVGTLVWCR